jgi:hypothetical protein
MKVIVNYDIDGLNAYWCRQLIDTDNISNPEVKEIVEGPKSEIDGKEADLVYEELQLNKHKNVKNVKCPVTIDKFLFLWA